MFTGGMHNWWKKWERDGEGETKKKPWRWFKPSSSTSSVKPEAPKLRRLITLHFRADSSVCHSWYTDKVNEDKWPHGSPFFFFNSSYTNRLWQSVQTSWYSERWTTWRSAFQNACHKSPPSCWAPKMERWPPPLFTTAFKRRACNLSRSQLPFSKYYHFKNVQLALTYVLTRKTDL